MASTTALEVAPPEAQLVFLDADGASGVEYRGPVSVAGIDVPAFSADRFGLRGQERAVLERVRDLLNRALAPRVHVTLEQPEPGAADHSTIHVGGDGAPFATFGAFVGLAEQIDAGNHDRNDIGFVFTDAFDPVAMDTGTLAGVLAGVVGHEIGHLVGEEHAAEYPTGSGTLDHVAFAQDAHQWLTRQGYLLFNDQFGASIAGREDYLDWFVLGAHDADEPDLNPFDNGGGADHPSLRHFWSHDKYARQYDDGFLGYDSAVNRAIKFMTGGIDYAGDPDSDWGKGQSRPGGMAPLAGKGAAALLSPDPRTAFYYLGQASHLLQDMAVPAHVHSDPHLEGWGFLDDPDPFHDWVDGKQFSQSGEGGLPKANFDAKATERYREWALVDEASKRLLRNEDSSRLRSARTIDPTFVSGTAAPDVEPLYRLFLGTAGTFDDFDSRNANGEKDLGSRGDTGNPLDNNYDNWTPPELNEIAALSVPTAIRNVAEILRYLFGLVDEQDPVVELTGMTSHNAAAPQVVYHTTLPIAVAASDEATGDSGIGKDLFRYEYRELPPGGTWSAWQSMPATATRSAHAGDLSSKVAPGSPLAGKYGAWAAPLFRGMFDSTYGFRVTAEDGAGRKTTSEASYVRVERPGVSVVSVIDRSASMLVSITDTTPTTCPTSESPNSRLKAAKNASSLFVDLMNPHDKIGVVAFSGTASVPYPLVEIDRGSATKNGARQAISGLSAICQGTSIGAGIEAAADELNRFPLDDARAMIVLTDGDNNTYPDPITAVNATPSDIRVYTIGLGADVNREILTQTAELRSGRYFSAGSSAELRRIYAELTGLIGGEQVIQSHDGFITPNQTHRSSFSADPSMSTVTVGLEWSAGNLDLELVAPDGTVLDHSAAAGSSAVHLIEGPDYEFLTVDAPAWGGWEVRVKAAGVPTQGEAYELFVRTDSSLYTALTHEPAGSLGRAGHFQVELNDGAPIHNATVIAEITPPVFSERRSTDVPKNIPDVSTITSTLVVGDSFTVTDVNVHLDITHPWIFDLTAYLVAPNGRTVELFDEPDTGANLTGTILDDEAIHGFLFNDPPFTGRFRPSGTLADFDGIDARGTWKLVVVDDSQFDSGRLDQWSLEFEGIPTNPAKTFVARLHDDGAHADGSAGDGIYGNDFFLGDTAGSYRVALNVTGTANLGYPFERAPTIVQRMLPSLRASVDVPRPIPDAGTTASSIHVAEPFAIGDVDVHLDITHPFVWDLDVFLIGPDGTRVELFTDVGGGGDNFTGTILDDEAAGGINDLLRTVAPFTGRHRPEGRLGDFDGRNAQGQWRLEITDDLGGHTGTLDRWGLSFQPATRVDPSFTVLLGSTAVPRNGTADFGTADSVAALSQSLRIRNDDDRPLSLGPAALAGGFILEQSARGQIPPGQSAAYTLRMSDATCGRRSGTMTLALAREHESPVPFSIDLKGVVGLWGNCPWTNRAEPLDVNGDLEITPLDVLILVNSLNAAGSRPLPNPPTSIEFPPPHYDTNGDNQLTPLDVLLVINYLNNPGSGEAVVPARAAPAASLDSLDLEPFLMRLWMDLLDDETDNRRPRRPACG